MKRQRGFSLIELMVAITIGLILLAALLGVIVSERRNYGISSTQSQLQMAGASLSSLLSQSARSSGFFACGATSSMTMLGAAKGVLGNFGNAVQAYDPAAKGWSPALDASLAGLNPAPAAGSAVVVFSGQQQGKSPAWVTSEVAASATALSVSSTADLAAGRYLAVANCAQSSVGLVQAVASGAVTLSAGLDTRYPAGSMAAPAAQTAYYVGQDQNGQGALYQASFDGSGATWSAPQAVVPGVDGMRLQYGVGNGSGSSTQYVGAAAVADWSKVGSVRFAFLLTGATGSAPTGVTWQAGMSTPGVSCPGNRTRWTLLGNALDVPCDTRLRNVYTMTVSIRNSGL